MPWVIAAEGSLSNLSHVRIFLSTVKMPRMEIICIKYYLLSIFFCFYQQLKIYVETNMTECWVKWKLKSFLALKGVPVTSYGTCLDNTACKETELTDENGSVFITKFKPESDLCFVAKAQGESHLVWWQQCLTTPSLDRKTEISINLENTEVHM